MEPRPKPSEDNKSHLKITNPVLIGWNLVLSHPKITNPVLIGWNLVLSHPKITNSVLTFVLKWSPEFG